MQGNLLYNRSMSEGNQNPRRNNLLNFDPTRLGHKESQAQLELEFQESKRDYIFKATEKLFLLSEEVYIQIENLNDKVSYNTTIKDKNEIEDRIKEREDNLDRLKQKLNKVSEANSLDSFHEKKTDFEDSLIRFRLYLGSG